MSEVWPYFAALIPVAGMAWLFWLVMKSLVESDRNERRAHSRWERESQSQREAQTPEKPQESVQERPRNKA